MSLAPGNTKTITIDVPLADLGRWDGGWVIDHGTWTVQVGRHSHDLPLAAAFSY